MAIYRTPFILTLFLFFVVFGVTAQDFDIKNYDIDITIRQNGALKIKETIDVFFTKAKHGIYKDIPNRYAIEFQPHLEKARYKFLPKDLLTMPISSIKVQPQPYTLEWQDYFLRIKIGDKDQTVEGNQRYIVEYEVDNIVAFYNNHIELNWNLIGEYWAARIEKATYTVHFPKPQTESTPITYTTFTGSAGSTSNDAQSAWLNALTLKGSITQPLEQQEAWTLNLFLPNDYFPYLKGDESFLAKRFIIKNYDAHYTLNKNGSTDVVLKADLKFINTVHSMWVDIENFATESGFGISGRWLRDHTYYPIENVKWQGGTQDDEDPFKVHFNNLNAGDEQTVQLSYTLTGNIIEDANHTGYSRVLFRNKNYFLGEPVISSKTTITLPISATLAKWQANIDTLFNAQNLSSRTEGNDIVIESKTPIAEENNFYQPSISIPADAVAPPSVSTNLGRWAMNNHWLSYPLLLLLSLVGLWYKKGRDKPITIVPQYYPPQGMTPAEAGILIDDKLHERDIIALIPYWASQGLIRIEEIETKVMLGLLKETDYKLIKLKPLENNVPAYEKKLFDGLFNYRNDVLLSSLRLTFYKTMDSVKQLLAEKVKANKHYEGKGIEAGRAMIILGIAVMVLSTFLLVILLIDNISSIHFFSIETAVGAFTLGLGMVLISRKMPKKSLLGVEVYQKLAGYRMFMQTAELPRIQQLIKEDPHYFDKSLPYAMVFDMADNWSNKFEKLNVPPPTWYNSNVHGLSSSQFTRRFSDASRSMSNTFTSAPSKSGSSGGSSSSGGGFGGGGGGSW